MCVQGEPANPSGFVVDAAVRESWLLASDDDLIRCCEVHRYRSSGPGGQHRNVTDSAVRLRHLPTGIVVTATESRSQHENLARAVRRLREAIALRVRCRVDVDGFALPVALSGAVRDGRLHLARRDPRINLFCAVALDLLLACSGRISAAAGLLGLSTSQLVAFLRNEPKRLSAANEIRRRFGLSALR